MSTFGLLNTSYTALTAARAGLEVVGQNIANVNTDGYTRQRISTSSVGGVANSGVLSNGLNVGQGVSVDGIARLGDIFLDAKVRSTAATEGFWNARASALTDIENILQEPGENGISAQLQEFWAAWQDVSNNPGVLAPASVLLEQAGVLASRVSVAHADIESTWDRTLRETGGLVSELNDIGKQVADLNARIRTATAAGASVNELTDHRSQLTARIASLAGGTARETADGTVEVLLGGNALVSGDIFRPVTLAGGRHMDTDAPRIEWAHRPGAAIALDGGRLAGTISVLAPADASGTGGTLAEAAEALNRFATSLAEKVNLVHAAGQSSTGATGLDFFAIDSALPAARGLTVVPTTVAEVAAGATGAGGFDGTTADAIAQLGLAPDGPDALWSSIVTGIGVASRTSTQQASLARISAESATGAQLAHSSVDLDEENVNLLTFQLAYQGAARVMTAVDEMLDTLINRTGIVGR